MSRVNSKLANGSDAIIPSSYELSEVLLTPSNGEVRNITDVVGQISIRESIYSGSLQADVNILDAANMLEKLKVVSGEVLDLTITRRLTNGQSDKYSHKFRIVEVTQFAKLSPGVQTYVFKLMSEHAYMSQLQTISRPFNNVPGQLIKNICTDILAIDDKELSINTETKQTIKGIYPRWRPMYIISWLTRRSYDNGSPFFFYETLGDGIHFNSYENMINKKTHGEYMHSPLNKGMIGSEDHSEQLKYKIIKLATDLNMSKYVNAAAGAYASTLHTLDIASKKYKKTTYTYGKDLKLNMNGVIPTGLKFNDRAIEEHRGSTNFYVSLNTSAAGGGSNYHAPSEGDILSANAYIENMDGTVLTINIYGDFKLSVGMVITCNIMKSVENADNKRGKDKYLSGKYLVTSIDHRFEDEYIMQVLLKKDSYIESLDTIDKIG
jgi:hypothetical protein